MASITFLGAAQTVTGSKYVVESGRTRVMIDCGLFQGLKELRRQNWEKLPVGADTIDAIALTHAHIDHIGYLPRLGKMGFRGPVFATSATCDLMSLLLYDAAKNQEEEADYANRKQYSKHHPALPLFDERDVAKVLKLRQPQPRESWFCLAEPIWIRYHDAGHLLGSSSIEMEIREERPIRVLFSGDVGRYNAPLYHDPSPPPACDYLVCESTYGDRDHPEGSALDGLAEVMQEAIARGGVTVVASFAAGRSQQLIYLLRVLIEQKRIPDVPIFLDSPMATSATEIFTEHDAEHDLQEGLVRGEPVFAGPNVWFARTTEESRAINQVRVPAVIISSSGMMTGGRILHHLRQRLPHEENTILLGGFSAAGTRARALEEGATTIRVHGRDVPVRAAVRKLSGLSGHADRTELLRWLSALPDPRRVFLTHGELAAMTALADQLKQAHGWDVAMPRLGERVELSAQ